MHNRTLTCRPGGLAMNYNVFLKLIRTRNFSTNAIELQTKCIFRSLRDY